MLFCFGIFVAEEILRFNILFDFGEASHGVKEAHLVGSIGILYRAEIWHTVDRLIEAVVLGVVVALADLAYENLSVTFLTPERVVELLCVGHAHAGSKSDNAACGNLVVAST